MWMLRRLLGRIGVGVVLAIAAARAPDVSAPIVQAARAPAMCQPLHDGMWRGEIVQLAPRPHLINVSLTPPNMMTIMIGCGSPKRT